MNNKRSLAVTEARYALTLLIFMLLMIGYTILNRLGGTADEAPMELRSGASGAYVAPVVPSAARTHDEEPPQVLPIESGEEPLIQTSHRSGAAAPLTAPDPVELR